MVDEHTVSGAAAPLALTLGDPAGIGAEVAARVIVARAADPGAAARPLLLVGAGWALEAGAAAAGIGLPALQAVDGPEAVHSPLALLDVASGCAGLGSGPPSASPMIAWYARR